MKTLLAILFALAILLIPGSHMFMMDGQAEGMGMAQSKASQLISGGQGSNACIAACLNNQHQAVTAAPGTPVRDFLLVLVPLVFISFAGYHLVKRLKPIALPGIARPPDLVLLHSRFLI